MNYSTHILLKYLNLQVGDMKPEQVYVKNIFIQHVLMKAFRRLFENNVYEGFVRAL